MREIKHLSVHQWLRSAIPDSQQPISPIGFLFLKLPPPPCAVLLVLLLSFFLSLLLYYIYNDIKTTIYTSSTAQGGGGSFKNRKPIGEVGCCESGMAERSH